MGELVLEAVEDDEVDDARSGGAGPGELPRLRDVVPVLQRAVAESPADQTELLWIASRSTRLTLARRAQQVERERGATLQARVIEGGRCGSYRTLGGDGLGLEHAMFMALAHATVATPGPIVPFHGGDQEAPAAAATFDRAAARWTEDQAVERLRPLLDRNERAHLIWGETRLAVCTSNGLRRRARLSFVAAEIRAGSGPGAGYALAASRSLAGVGLETLVERARARHGRLPPGTISPARGRPLVLAPEATARLIELTAHHGFSSEAYRAGACVSREHSGVQVFDQRFTLRDDGSAPEGLSLPFDLEGTSKRPIALIDAGIARQPALDRRSAAELGLEATGHCVGDSEGAARHLFLDGGQDSVETLLQSAGTGIWAAMLDRACCLDGPRLRFVARLRGVREITGGELGAPLPDLLWEDTVPRAFSTLLGLGAERVTVPIEPDFLGAVRAPAMALGETESLRPLAGGRR